MGRGASLLFVYSLGLGIPFIIAAFAMERFAGFMNRFRKHIGKIEKIMGLFLILTGIAFLAGFFTQLNSWLLELFPALQTIG